MKWKNRLTNYNFWISIVSAVLLILQAFDINFDIAYINEIATGVLGLLVVIGIINDPTRTVAVENVKKQEIVKEKPLQEKVEEIVETSNETNQPEEEIKEESETIPSNIEDETVDEFDKNNFQTIIDFISREIEKATAHLKVKEENNVDNEISKKEEPIAEQEQVNVSNEVVEETENSEPTCYNIVN